MLCPSNIRRCYALLLPTLALLALQRQLTPELLLHTQLTLRTSSVHMQINQSQIPTTQTALLSPNTKLSCSGPLLSCLTRSYTFDPLQSFRLASPVLSLTVKAQQSPHESPEPLSPDHLWCFQTSLWGNVSNQLSF